MPQINLLPPELRARQRAQRILTAAAAAGLVILLLLVGVFFVQRNTISTEQDELADLQGQAARLRAEVAQLQEFGELKATVDQRRATLAVALQSVFDFPGLAGWLTRISQLEGLTFVYLTSGARAELAGREIVNFGANANVTPALLSQRCQEGEPCP